MNMTAAQFFGQNYREATRKRGEDEGRRSRPGMKTLSDQVNDDEDAGQRIRFSCPECESETIVRKPLTRAAEGAEDEDEAGRLLQARCSACEAELNLEAPRGYRWASEAVHFFTRRYQRATSESARRHRHLTAAMRIR